jgi:hypothetical protein
VQGQQGYQAIREIATHETVVLTGRDLTIAQVLRKAPDSRRQLGNAPARAHAALRAVVPWLQPLAEQPQRPVGEVAYAFMQGCPGSSFYPERPPPAEVSPLAGTEAIAG